MIRTIQDFLDRWHSESASTLAIFNHLTDASLGQAVSPEGRTLGRLANHIIETLSEMPHRLGLPIDEASPAFATAHELVQAYHTASDKLVFAISTNWTDLTLEHETNMYGELWKNGFSLWVLILHQAHHRGQMTVLMRQAGLKVPGIYGPSREEWAAMNMPPMK